MEEWLPALGFETSYEVSSLGRVRSSKKVGKNVLKPKKTKQGYSELRLSLSGKAYSVRVHRLVCATFNGPPPFGKPLCLHRDDDPSNNHKDNLRWGTRLENANDALKNNRYLRGESCGSATHEESSIIALITERREHKTSYDALAAKYKISKAQANKICRGLYWKHLTHG